MEYCEIPSEKVRLLGRMDETQRPLCLDWTGSGFEVRFKGKALWAELEASAEGKGMWVSVTVDGYPVSRFLVETGKRWFPLVYDLTGDVERTVALHKDTQASDNCVMLYGIRYEGELLPLPEPSMKIEFVGDSITSAEGALAPHHDDEFSAMWYSSVENYAHYCCRELGAEGRLMSRGGIGVCWDWQFRREGNIADSYEKIVGLVKCEDGIARGCQKDHDFTKWKPDIVCIRLTANDIGGIKREIAAGRGEGLKEELKNGAAAFIRKVHRYNPQAKIIWILPSTKSIPSIAVQAVISVCGEIPDVFYFDAPDYRDEELAARNHPDGRYHERCGKELARFISRITKQ